MLHSVFGIRWVFGTWAVIKDVEGGTCASTVPLLYSFCLVVVVIYWIGFVFGVIGLVQVIFGRKIRDSAQATLEKVRDNPS